MSSNSSDSCNEATEDFRVMTEPAGFALSSIPSLSVKSIRDLNLHHANDARALASSSEVSANSQTEQQHLHTQDIEAKTQSFLAGIQWFQTLECKSTTASCFSSKTKRTGKAAVTVGRMRTLARTKFEVHSEVHTSLLDAFMYALRPDQAYSLEDPAQFLVSGPSLGQVLKSKYSVLALFLFGHMSQVDPLKLTDICDKFKKKNVPVLLAMIKLAKVFLNFVQKKKLQQELEQSRHPLGMCLYLFSGMLLTLSECLNNSKYSWKQHTSLICVLEGELRCRYRDFIGIGRALKKCCG